MKQPSSGFLHEEGPTTLDPAGSGDTRNSKFLAYYSWLRSARGVLLDGSSAFKSLFPCHLPYPEVVNSEGVSIGGDLDRTVWAKQYLNSFIAWCNYIELGCPDCRGSEWVPLGTYQSGNLARTFTDRLLGEVVEFGSLDLIFGQLQCQGGRRAVEEIFSKVVRSSGGYECTASDSNLAGALPVFADRVAVPSNAGTVDPTSLLPPEKAEVVRNLEDWRKPEHQWDEVPHCCHRVPEEEEARLVRKLLKHNMVKLIPECDLPKDSFGNILLGGLFCVPKNESEDRLIFDRRAENATMHRIKWARLPAGACFCRMRLQPNEYVRGSGDDLRNYYYCLSLPDNWVRYNSFGRRIPVDVVREAGGDPNLPHRACMRVLGMGDKNACDIAQAVHESLLMKFGLLNSTEKLVYGEPVPAGAMWQGVYLDDLLVSQKCQHSGPIPLDGSFIPPLPSPLDQDQQSMKAAEEAYAHAGFERAVHKAFRGATQFKAWGAEIDGILGTAAAPLIFRQQVWLLLFRVVELGHCTRHILQKLLGYLCFAFQYRRELFSLMHHIFKFVQKLPKKGWRKLPGFIIDELRSMMLHLAFAKWKMRRDVHPTLLATDATPSSGGAARTFAPEGLREELWRLSESRGEVVRLDETELDRTLKEWQSPKEPSKMASVLGRTMCWKTTSSYHFRQTSHINLQETRALRLELKKMLKDPKNIGCIQVALNDSRVLCGAIGKGRSSSFKLNGLLRGFLPYQILGDIVLALIWVETHANPADYPSRFTEIPRPLRRPDWLQQHFSGLTTGCGWEIFAGSCRLTQSHLEAGITMLDPVEILLGRDVFDDSIDEIIRSGRVLWVWFAPPCGETALGNKLWYRALDLINACMSAGVFFFLEHPQNSKAWQLPRTVKLLSKQGVSSVVVHWCMYEDDRDGALPNKKATRIVCTAPWLKEVVRQCTGDHLHGPPLRGSRAKAAGAYPKEFCSLLASACASYTRWSN